MDYVYDTTIKDKLLQIKNRDTEAIVQNISYSTTDAFKPISMNIFDINFELTWQGKRLLGIGGDNCPLADTNERCCRRVGK